MASLLPLLFLLLFPANPSALGNEVRILEAGPAMLVVEVITSDYQIEALVGEKYLRLRAPGHGYTSNRGEPLLPVKGLLVGMPLQGTLTAHVREEEWTALETGLICPVPSPSSDLPDVERPEKWQLSLDNRVYGRDAFYPNVLVEAEPLGLFRDQRIGRIRLFPFRYNPMSHQLKVCHRLVVQVNFHPQSSSNPPESIVSRASPAAEQVLSDMLLNYAQAKPWRVERTAQVAPKTMAAQEDVPRCKITVSEDGLYAILPEELADAELDVDLIDPRTFQLSNRGKTVPIYVRGEKDGSFDKGDAIEFYGEANRWTSAEQGQGLAQDPYSSKNVYWLSWISGPGARLVEEDGGIRDPGLQKPISYESLVHAEEDNYRDHLNQQLSSADHWFWDSGISAQEMADYPLQLPHPDRDSPLRPRVQVMLHGLTSSELYEPDHHVLIYLNDRLVADRRWDGQAPLLIDSAEDGFEFTSSAIQDGDNILSLICPGDTEAGPIDRILLNWIQVEYPRLYRAEDDQVEFSKPKGGAPGSYRFTVKGFSSPSVWVYKLGTSVVVNGQGEWVRDGQETYYQLTFQDEILDHQTRYLAVTSTAKKRVDSIVLRPPSDLTAPGKGADYVIIAHEDFCEQILPLAELRRNQGLVVEVIDVSEIYDQFSHGLFTPEAIEDFLKYAYQNWDPQPLYVILVGDGSWDYKDSMGLGGNFIPPIMTQTYRWGSTPCDNLYACTSGDDQLPDLFLGRLPVQTNEELEAIVNKIIGAEEEPELGDWRRRLLFVCGSGAYGPIFRSQSESLIRDHVTADFLLSRVYAYSTQPGTDPYYGGTQDLTDALDEGSSLINFIGHGGGGIWSDASLMRLEDVDKLHNAHRWPLALSMTCFTAAFDEPKRQSLGERLLLVEEIGMSGFWGSSGLGWLNNDYNLNDALMKTIFSHGRRIIGQMVTEAKLEYMAAYSGQIALDLVNEYTLLGDPASRISFPRENISLFVQPEAVNPGDTLDIQGAMDGEYQGQAQLSILDSSGVVLWESSLAVMDGRFQVQTALPPTCSTGTGTVRCYFTDSQNMTDGSGTAFFSVGQAFFDTIFTDPAKPTHEDTVHIWTQIFAPQGIDSVLCHWKMGLLDSTKVMIAQAVPHQYRTATPIQAINPGLTVRYWVIAKDSSGHRTTSARHNYRIPTLADVHIPYDGFTVGGEEQVGISVQIENLGETQAESVLVRVAITEPIEQAGVKEDVIEYLPGESQTSLFFPWDLPSAVYAILAEADPQDAIQEGNEGNNAAQGQIEMDRFNVTPQEGTTVDGHHAPAFSVDGNFSCAVPSGAVNRPGEPLAYQVAFADSAATVSELTQILLTFRLADPDSLSQGDELAVYRWNPIIQRWIRHAEVSCPTPDSALATAFGLGLFCLMTNSDQAPPSIEVTVEDQHFSDDALVSTNAKIVAVIQDANGVDALERQVEVLHNQQAVAAQEIVVSLSPDRNSVPVSYSTKFSTGRHSITFAAYDCNGNLASKTVDFQVINSYDIDHVGNYPNPFDEETVFTYRLTGPEHADEISLKIYTVSGRLIKSYRDFVDEFGRLGTGLDYHAKAWDGRNEDGDPLANGVYFYKIRAKWADRTVEKTGKLAILR